MINQTNIILVQADKEINKKIFLLLNCVCTTLYIICVSIR